MEKVKRRREIRNQMKVFQINTVCGVGSTGRITTDLYHVLEKKATLAALPMDAAVRQKMSTA